jgi:hypothetical protein
MRADRSHKFEALREKYKSSTISFLLTELETGMTFARIAAESNDEEKKLRCSQRPQNLRHR